MKITNVLAIALLAVAGATRAEILVHAGRLIDGEADRPETEMTIRVDGRTIVGIERGYTAAGPDDTVIDLTDYTVMPGLMDMHTHLDGEYSEDSRLQEFIMNEADYAFDAAKFAKRTLLAGFTVVRNLGDSFNVTVALVRPKAAAIGPVIKETFRRAYEAGVPIVFDTDSGVSPHGDNAREFTLMVEAGMPPMEAIQSATSVAARFLGIEDTHGTLEAGKQADVVAVPGDPLEDIHVMERVAFVMKAGRVYKRP